MIALPTLTSALNMCPCAVLFPSLSFDRSAARRARKAVSSLKAVVTVAYRRREGGIREAAAAALQGAEVERSVQLSCGEHTDYGLLTLVNQDTHVSALQVFCLSCKRLIW